MMTKKTVVIGAGIIGLAIARRLAQLGREVTVLERNTKIGMETSFRNSAVIHAGLHYTPGSLKAKLCLPGAAMLYHYCKENKVPYKKIGQLLVATNDQEQLLLKMLQNQAKTNGLLGLSWLSKQETKQLEPAVEASAALFNPHEGIVDGKKLLQSLYHAAEGLGANILCNTSFLTASKSKRFSINIEHEQRCEIIEADELINAAGLWAVESAHHMTMLKPDSIPKMYFAKGSYFKLEDTPPFQHLIYPVPEQAGLGIHATIDINHQVWFGPDVEWVDHIDYSTSSNQKEKFVPAIQRYYPSLDPHKLMPAPERTGIRPKIKPPQQQPQDFVIENKEQHGVRGLVNLFGIESPGLSSSLAIADHVARLLL